MTAVFKEHDDAGDAVFKAAVIARKPARLTHAEAAAMASTGLTALCALEDTAKLKPGETILIHGSVDGIAGLTIQLAKHLGAIVLATASESDHDQVRALGAVRVIDLDKEDFAKVVVECDVVFDAVGGEVQVRSYDVLKPGGRLVWVAPAPAGFEPPRWDVQVLRPDITRDRAHLERVLALVETGAVSPPTVRPKPGQVTDEVSVRRTPVA